MKTKTTFNPKTVAEDMDEGTFHASGCPIGEATANKWFAALWGRAHSAGLVSGPLTEDFTPAWLRVYNENGASGYVYVLLAVSDVQGRRAVTVNHRLARLVRRMACSSSYLRDYVRSRLDSHRRGYRCVGGRPDSFRDRLAAKPLTPAAFNYDRAVGVEMECFAPVGEETFSAALPLWCRRASDGSIRADEGFAHEVRALLTRSEMEPRLFRLCKTLQAVGAQVNKTCGLHVHLDQRGETFEAVKKRAQIVNAWLERLQELVPASRRSNEYCKWGISENDRYRAVNLTAFRKYSTLEIRLHSGTVDYTKVLAWIRLCELLAAMKTKPKAGGCIATLEQLPLPSHDLAYWRARHRTLNPHLYSNSNTTNEQE